VTDSRPSPGTGPSVCPFVALAEDRDRRADSPDEDNRCYAERAPRRRDLVYQSEYCYSADFARCSVFLAWAARSAAEPADVTEAAGRAMAAGARGASHDPAADVAPATEAADGEAHSLPAPTPEHGLFGLPESDAPEEVRTSEQLEWVSATAWAEAPWDERAELEAEELDAFEAVDDEPEEELEDGDEPAEEATTAPKVPAALPLRRRKPPQEPIRSRGSGEWFYADPPGRQPLVSHRYGVTPQVLLVILAILVVSTVAFLIATQLGGQTPSVAVASPTPARADQVRPTRAPTATSEPSAAPEPTATPRPRYYRVRAGDSLTGIAARFDVRLQHLQCLNGITDRNLIVLGARYEIPPEGYSCPPGWRRPTPEP
jgi:LysM repeat protein